jgi:hypothetical protein
MDDELGHPLVFEKNKSRILLMVQHVSSRTSLMGWKTNQQIRNIRRKFRSQTSDNMER